MIKNNNDITLFSGCGHSGINNIVNTAKVAFHDNKIKNIVGGFHFQAGKISSFNANSKEIEATSRGIQSEGLTKVYTGHCTGRYGFEIMHSILKDDLELLYTGKKIYIWCFNYLKIHFVIISS